MHDATVRMVHISAVSHAVRNNLPTKSAQPEFQKPAWDVDFRGATNSLKNDEHPSGMILAS